MRNLTFLMLTGIVALTSCGDSHSLRSSSANNIPVASRSSSASFRGYVKGDDDEDETEHVDRDDFPYPRHYGRAGSASEQRAVIILISSYYRAAASLDGAMACSLIDAPLKGATRLVAAAEAYAPSPTAPLLSGKSCAYIMRLLFKEHHAQLLAEAHEVVVTSVRVKSHQAIAFLASRTRPEREFPVEREGDLWKLESLMVKEII